MDMVDEFIKERNERAAAATPPPSGPGGDYHDGGRSGGTDWAAILRAGPQWRTSPPSAARDQAGRFARPTGDEAA